MTPVRTSVPAPVVQRCGGRRCPAGTCDHNGNMLRRAVGSGADVAGAAAVAAPPVVHQVLRSAGRPLEGGTRGFMESRLGHDFSRVRVHTDARAAESADAVGAHAYTVGSDVVFAAGRYAPATSAGQRLLAHELTHVVQQHQGGGGEMAAALEVGAADTPQEREADRAAASVQRAAGSTRVSAAVSAAPRRVARQEAPEAAPNYGPACRHPNPCQQDRCTGEEPATVRGDLDRAFGYVDRAVRALQANPLSDETVRALDWYFVSHSPDTVRRVREQLECIRWCLNDTRTNSRWGCHPDYNPEKAAYVCSGGVGVCAHQRTPVCVNKTYFGEGDRVRAQIIVHECAHREGMSTDAEGGKPDIYVHRLPFLNLSTDQALLNSDSYALFVGGVAEGVPTTVLGTFGAAGGLAAPARGEATWYARLYAGAEFQHPALSIYNPTLGLGVTLIGESTSGGAAPVTSGPSYLISLLQGVRISPPRPGSAGSGYMSFFGGPSLALGLGLEGGVGVGAEAGAAVGYRWRWLDVSAGIGYAYDPTRRPGQEHLTTLGGTVTFIPEILR